MFVMLVCRPYMNCLSQMYGYIGRGMLMACHIIFTIQIYLITTAPYIREINQHYLIYR